MSDCNDALRLTCLSTGVAGSCSGGTAREANGITDATAGAVGLAESTGGLTGRTTRTGTSGSAARMVARTPRRGATVDGGALGEAGTRRVGCVSRIGRASGGATWALKVDAAEATISAHTTRVIWVALKAVMGW